MALTATVPADGDAARQSARDSRYMAQRLLWRRSTLKTVRGCSRAVVPDLQHASVLVTPTPEGARAGLGGIMRCGSPWSCPVCSHKIAQARAEEIAGALRGWDSRGGRVAFLTLTMRHDATQDLRDQFLASSFAWGRVTSGSVWNDDQARYGTSIDGKTRVPWVRAVEATHGANGWHVHIHAFLFLPAGMSDDALQALGGAMFARWQRGLKSKGRSAVASVAGESVGVDIKWVDCSNDAAALSDYITKSTYDGAMLAAMEAARGQQKKGARFGNRTPFTMLANVVQNLDNADDSTLQRQAVQDLMIWQEWEAGSRGRRQVTWSKGLRDLLALDPEADDQAIVDEDNITEDTIVVQVFTPDEWRVAQRDIAKILRDAERHANEFLLPLLAADPDALKWAIPELEPSGVVFPERVRVRLA